MINCLPRRYGARREKSSDEITPRASEQACSTRGGQRSEARHTSRDGDKYCNGTVVITLRDGYIATSHEELCKRSQPETMCGLFCSYRSTASAAYLVRMIFYFAVTPTGTNYIETVNSTITE